jgi:hypothetical protein
METETMYGDRDVTCMVPQIFGCLSAAYGMPGGIRHSLLVDAIRYGIELVSIRYTGSVYGQTLKGVKDTLFFRKSV